jgi:hypothetical protein
MYISNLHSSTPKTTHIYTQIPKNYEKSAFRVGKRDVLAYLLVHLTQLKGLRQYISSPALPGFGTATITSPGPAKFLSWYLGPQKRTVMCSKSFPPPS